MDYFLPVHTILHERRASSQLANNFGQALDLLSSAKRVRKFPNFPPKIGKLDLIINDVTLILSPQILRLLSFLQFSLYLPRKALTKDRLIIVLKGLKVLANTAKDMCYSAMLSCTWTEMQPFLGLAARPKANSNSLKRLGCFSSKNAQMSHLKCCQAHKAKVQYKLHGVHYLRANNHSYIRDIYALFSPSPNNFEECIISTTHSQLLQQ